LLAKKKLQKVEHLLFSVVENKNPNEND